jgi:hypothetical protein
MTVQDEERVGSCWECGYLLRGLETPRCPECGRKFDPHDEATMNMGWEVRRVVKWLMRPPGWPTHFLTGLAVLMSVWAAASPMGRDAFVDLLNLAVRSRNFYPDLRTMVEEISDPLGRFLISAMLWLAVAIVWISRRVARGITVKRLSKQKAAPLAYWRRWLLTPVVFGLTVLLCRSALPMWAGFWLSKSAMEGAIERARVTAPKRGAFFSGGQVGIYSTGWLGIYPAPPPISWRPGTLQWDGTEAVFEISTNAWGRPMGYFVYRNDGRAPELPWINRGAYSSAHRVRHLYGPWYVVEVNPYGAR